GGWASLAGDGLQQNVTVKDHARLGLALHVYRPSRLSFETSFRASLKSESKSSSEIPLLSTASRNGARISSNVRSRLTSFSTSFSRYSLTLQPSRARSSRADSTSGSGSNVTFIIGLPNCRRFDDILTHSSVSRTHPD